MRIPCDYNENISSQPCNLSRMQQGYTLAHIKPFRNKQTIERERERERERESCSMRRSKEQANRKEAAETRREKEGERETIGMGKDMGTRYAGAQDAMRLFNRAVELLASPAPESEQELLELVKKAKRDADKDHPPAPTAVKKPSRRGVAEVADFQALGHRPNPASLAADHGSGQQSGSGSEGGTSNSTTVNSGSIGHAQARIMNVIRSGPGRGRIDKPKRKGTR